MADFQAQVEALSGLTITSSTSPTLTELSQFLKDGVVDVINRCIIISPRERESFSRESAEQTSNGFNPGSNEIIAVLREDGTNNQWYPCRKENIGLQYRVTDTSSLHYASKYSPVYMISQNRNIHVYPEPSASGNDTFKVLYVNYDAEETDGTDLQYNSTGIKWFPDDKVYLVIIYASIKSLYNALSAHKNPTVVPNFGDAENLINIEEDAEMLAGRIQTINAQIADYQAKVQESVVDYGWMEQRAKSLIQEYNSAFASMAGPQPKGNR